MLALCCLKFSVVAYTLIVLCCSSKLYGWENGLLLQYHKSLYYKALKWIKSVIASSPYQYLV